MRVLKRVAPRPPIDTPSAGRATTHDNPLAEALPDLGDAPLFREEAVREHGRNRAAEGEIVRISPRWANAVYWLLIAAFALALLFAVFGRMPEYATGPGVVRLAGQTEINAAAAGVVVVVEAQTGDRVQSGQILLRLDARDEENLVEKMQLDFDHELIAFLRAPGDPSARSALGRTRADLDLARARLERRLLRAPADGTVHDMRVWPGQVVSLGQPVASLLQADRKHELVALIPGRYHPLLRRGQRLRLRITGYSAAYVDMTIDGLGDAVIGPTEARRFLGPEIGDAVPVTAPVVLVRALLPGSTFPSDGKQHAYCSGLQGNAEVRVGDERIVFGLLPWTKSLRERWNAWRQR